MQACYSPRWEESGAWLGWALAQGVWLVAMADRVKLSAKWPETGERWSGEGMVMVQLILACAMGQALLKDVRSWVYASAIAAPMLGLAVMQGGGTLQEAWPGIVAVLLWLGVLARMGSIRIGVIQMLLRTAMLIVIVGGPIFLYLVLEFGRHPVAWDGVIAYVSPTVGGVKVLTQGWKGAGVMGVPVGLLVLTGGIGYLLGNRIERQQSM